jgi:hypothetical protein
MRKIKWIVHQASGNASKERRGILEFMVTEDE